jgi:hypothetical protein
MGTKTEPDERSKVGWSSHFDFRSDFVVPSQHFLKSTSQPVGPKRKHNLVGGDFVSKPKRRNQSVGRKCFQSPPQNSDDFLIRIQGVWEQRMEAFVVESMLPCKRVGNCVIDSCCGKKKKERVGVRSTTLPQKKNSYRE